MTSSRHVRHPKSHAYGGKPLTFYRFGYALARYRWVAIACWVALLLASLVLLPRFENALTGPPLGVLGSESERAEELLDERFTSPFNERDLIVFQSDRLTVRDPAYQRVVADAIAAVVDLPQVVGIVGPLDPRATDQVSSDGHVAAAVVGLSGSGRSRQQLAPELTRRVEAVATDDVRVYLTGKSPLVADLVQQEREDLARAERLGLPVALLILVLTSGSLVAAGIPILLALVGGGVAFGVLGAATSFMSFNLFVPNIATMLGLGVGIDYSLFVVTRYREELAHGASPAEAVAATVATAGKTVFFSGVTVLLSLAGLLLVDAQIFHELAVGAITSVGVMIAGALTLVPSALAALGHRVDTLAIPFLGRPGAHPAPEGGLWARWARLIMRHPGLWAIGAVLILLAMTAPVTDVELGLSTGTSDLNHKSSGKGREILAQDFNEGVISPIQVVVVSPDGPLNDDDLATVARLTSALEAEGGVARVISVTKLLDQFVGNHSTATLETAARIPQATSALSDLVNFGKGRDVTVIRVIPHARPNTDAAIQLLRRIREAIVPSVSGGAGADVVVGGLTAQIVDISDESAEKLPIVGGLVVGMSFLLLAVIFRSLILPIKAIIMNLLSISAAYGMLVLVFQEGAGEEFFEFTSPGTTQVYLPLLTFTILFGLSMDYEVFLLGRMKEEWERTRVNEIAVAHGLQHTARVITSAAAIMVAVFAAFTFTRVMEIQALGFSLAVAIFVDATLVRIVLVPALMQLMGRWNWWFPAWLERVTPRVDLAEAHVHEPVVAARAEGVTGS